MKKYFYNILTLIPILSPLFTFANIEPIDEVWGPKPGNVAVIQWAPPYAQINVTKDQAEQIKSRNRNLLLPFIEEAKTHGAQWIVSSELVVVGYPDIPELPDEEDNFRTREEILPYAETIPGPSTIFFSKYAISWNIFIQFGLVEIDNQGKLYNTVVVINPSGELVTEYRKINLFHQENNYFTPGNKPSVFLSPFGLVGMIICSDVYDYRLLNEYSKMGVTVLSLSTSWVQYNTGMNYFRRAAKSINVYLLAANQPYFPDSGVINPDGSHQSHIRQSNGVAYGNLPNSHFMNH